MREGHDDLDLDAGLPDHRGDAVYKAGRARAPANRLREGSQFPPGSCAATAIRKIIYAYSHLSARLRPRILIFGVRPVHRLTINLPPELHAALKAAAARRGTTIGSLVQESLEAYGIKPERDVRELVAAARARSGLSADEAERLALQETRAARDR
jgi:hypothetical protein